MTVLIKVASPFRGLRLVVGMALALVASGAAGYDGGIFIAIPPSGTVAVYDCSGPYAKHIELAYADIGNGLMRIEAMEDIRRTWDEQPVTLLGTTLYTRRDRRDRRGIRDQTFDLADFGGAHGLEPGKRYVAEVTERDDYAKWSWHYEVTAGQHETIENPHFGTIEVVTVSEKRSATDGPYASEMESLVYPAGPLVLRWTYADNKGIQRCSLVDYRE